MPDKPAPEDITRILASISQGTAATDDLIPLVYSELHRLARSRIVKERSGESGPTSLLHEAYIRLVGGTEVSWESRAHFFAAAGEAMRRILIDRARRRDSLKRGGDRMRVDLATPIARTEPLSEDLLALNEALTSLEAHDRGMADVVKLRYFAGLTVEETADALGQSPRSVNRTWTAARAWLKLAMES